MVARPRGVLKIGSVVGVPILLTPSWFLFAAYITLFGRGLVDGGARAYFVSASFAVLLLVSVILHEIGHCLTARAFGLPVRSITVNLMAGLTEITEPPQTPAREYAVAISGPMVSLLLCSVGIVTLDAFEPDSTARLLFANVAITNGVIAALNLLPGLPLDGGRVLKSLVWQVTKDPVKATRWSAYSGIGIAIVLVPFLVVGLLPALGVGDRSLTTIILSALVGTFIYAGARASLTRADVLDRLPGVTVAALARPALTVAPTLPLAEAVRKAHEAGVRALVVVDSAERVEGVVSEAWVRQVPKERRPWVQVADGARRIEPGLLLGPDLVGEALLEAMRATPASEYVVSGQPPRVLVSSDVAAAMSGSAAPQPA